MTAKELVCRRCGCRRKGVGRISVSTENYIWAHKVVPEKMCIPQDKKNVLTIQKTTVLS